jgi:hypothetical protein
MIRRLDAWIGTRLFHPPIIWLCQRAGMTQFALHRYIWWAVALLVVYRNDWKSWAWSAFVIFFALTRTISAAVAPDRAREGALWFRVLIWALIVLSVPDIIAGASPNERVNVAILFAELVAEYAITIRTIPPRKRRERAAKAQEAFS